MSTPTSTALQWVASEDNLLVTGAVGVTAILATTAACYYLLGPGDKEHEFTRLRGIQFYHAWNFLQRRYDFFQSNFKRNGGKSFSFDVRQHHVIALAGEDS